MRGQEEENERGRIRRRRRKQVQPCQVACRQRGRESREYEKGATNIHVASCLRIICCGRTDFQWQAAAMAPRTWCMQYLQFDCMRTRDVSAHASKIVCPFELYASICCMLNFRNMFKGNRRLAFYEDNGSAWSLLVHGFSDSVLMSEGGNIYHLVGAALKKNLHK